MARLFKRAPWRITPGKLGKQKFIPSYASPDVTLSLTGQSVTSSAGFVKSAVAYSATGQSATSSAGTVVNAVAYSAIGRATTSSAGLVARAVAYSASGQAATSNAGTVVPALSRSITGSSATSSAGTVVSNVSYSFGGSSITATAGTVTVTAGNDVSVTLTGSSATSSAGSVKSAAAYSASGQAASTSSGTVVNQVGYPITGQSMTSASGTLTASVSGDVTISLTGQSISVSQGALGVSGGDSSGIKPAGRPKRSQTRRRAIIEIDGQEFFVSSEEEAQALLDKAIEESERIAAIKAEEVVNKRRQRQKRDGYLNKSPIKIDKPEISFDNGVDYAQELMHAFNQKLDEIYRKAAEEAEISLLIKNKIEEEDDEAITYLLL